VPSWIDNSGNQSRGPIDVVPLTTKLATKLMRDALFFSHSRPRSANDAGTRNADKTPHQGLLERSALTFHIGLRDNVAPWLDADTCTRYKIPYRWGS
jgi:hypothetical protein